MVHLHYFMPPKVGITQQEFSDYYRHRHIHALGDKPGPNFGRYVQSHRVPSPKGNASFYAVAEVWNDDEAAWLEFSTSPALEVFRTDERNFADVPKCENLATIDHAIVDGKLFRGMVKAIMRLRRRDDMRYGEFRRYWLDVHAPKAAEASGIRRYVASYTIDNVYHLSEPRWDGVAHVWFDDAVAAERAMAPGGSAEPLMTDLARFTSCTEIGFAVEHYLKWPERVPDRKSS